MNGLNILCTSITNAIMCMRICGYVKEEKEERRDAADKVKEERIKWYVKYPTMFNWHDITKGHDIYERNKAYKDYEYDD